MLEVDHTIMLVGACLCIVSFCVGFRLGRDYKEGREYKTLTEEKVQAMIVNAITKTMRNTGTVGKHTTQ